MVVRKRIGGILLNQWKVATGWPLLRCNLVQIWVFVSSRKVRFHLPFVQKTIRGDEIIAVSFRKGIPYLSAFFPNLIKIKTAQLNEYSLALLHQTDAEALYQAIHALYLNVHQR